MTEKISLSSVNMAALQQNAKTWPMVHKNKNILKNLKAWFHYLEDSNEILLIAFNDADFNAAKQAITIQE